MPVPQVMESLVLRYEKSAVLRGLVQLIPLNIGSAVDTAVLTRLQTVRAERAREFFDELAKSEGGLNPELLESNEFLHCFFATADAALRTSRIEKIHAFARLLGATTQRAQFSSIDEFEEFLSILDDLSNRELAVLILLDQYEINHPKLDNENDLQRTNRFWGDFSSEISSDLGILPEEVDSVLSRLNRSGCYETFTGSYLSYTGGRGKITPFFRRLKSVALGA